MAGKRKRGPGRKPAGGARRAVPDLRESREQFRLAQEALGIVTWIWDAALDRAKWHGNIDQLLGLQPGSFSGRFEEYLRYVHPEDRVRARGQYVSCLKGEAPEYRSEERVVWPDGTEQWLETYGRATYGRDGRAIRMTGVIKNITPRKRQETALARAERKYVALFDSSPEAVIITRLRDAVILNINAAWERYSGFRRNRVIGRTAFELRTWIDPEDRTALVARLDAEGLVSNFVTRFRRADGGEIEVLLSAARIEIEGEACAIWSWRDVSDLREAERRAHQSEHKFVALFESSPEAITVLRLSDGVRLAANAAWECFTGYPRAQAIGQPAATMTLFRDQAQRAALIARVAAEGSVSNVDARLMRADGSERDALISAVAIELEGERCILWCWRDVTSEREIERARHEADARYRALFESAIDGMVIYRPDGLLLDANPAICRTAGYAREEIIGRHVSAFLDPAEVARIPIRADVAERWGRIERMLPSKSGDGIPMEIVSGPMPDGNVLAILRDITERKRNETLLINVARGVSTEVGEGFFQTLVERLAGELGADYAYISELLPPDALRLRTLAFVVDGALAPNTEYPVAGSVSAYALAARRTVILPHRVAERFPGTEIGRHGIQAYVGTPLYGADGATLGVLSVAHRKPIEQGGQWASMIEIFGARAAAEIERSRADALVRRTNASLEQRVRERTVELEEANRDLDSYNFSVSHDLRQPLNAIAGFSELLRENLAGDEASEALEYTREIETNATRMEQMIEALLGFSRAGRGALERSQVDMRAQVDSVLRDLMVAAPLRARITIGDLPPAQGDATLLRQVWSNLIGNALKYSARAEAPHIEIGAARRNGAIEYCVRDNGIGFDMRDVDQLFGVFQRLPSSAGFEGTGVGLAIVQRIVRRHGGGISAESASGQGATIRFSLPE